MTDPVSTLSLRPMTPDSFRAFVAEAVPRYAAEKVESRQWDAQDAPERAAREYEQLLPGGMDTPGHTLLDLWSGAEQVGVLWYAQRPDRAGQVIFVFEVEIFEAFRRRGLARAAFEQLAERARAEGASAIELHVFGHNHAARTLYEGLGFQPTSLMLRQAL